MKLDLSNVNYSNFDIKLNVKVPSILDSKLSYLSGVHMGDGSMGNYKKYYYSIEYSGHLTDEYDFYANYFNKLFKDLFNKELRVYRKFKDNGSYLCLCTQLKGIFTFLSTALNLPIGPKKYAPIPEIIINSPYLKDFIRGYADADFCLTFKKRNSDIHYYPSISLKSSSKIMVLQLSDSLKQLGFSVYNLLDFPSPRYGITHVANFIDINGVKQLENWMKLIGFNSRKHLTKYLVWKKFGFCPPYTSLHQREAILNEELNPYSFYKS